MPYQGYQYDPFASSILNDDPLGIRRQPTLRPLPPLEQDSLLQRLTGTALSGLGYVGSVLDKTFGGRAIRGVLGGHPAEALSLIPGSDTFGLTDESNRVSGEDLLKQWGMLEGEGEKGTFEARDLAGPGLEMALDPATYLTLGASALTKTGQAARAAGKLEPTLLGRIRAGQGGLAGLGLPFSDPSAVLGTGARAEQIAGKLGNVADAVKYSAPGRHLSAMLDKTAQGTSSEVLQRALREQAGPTEAAKAQARLQLTGMARSVADAGELGEHSSDVIRSAMEGNMLGLPADVNGRQQQAVADQLSQMIEGQFRNEHQLGIDTPRLADYAPRQRTPLDQETRGFASRPDKPLDPFNPHMIGREEILDVPGGTVGGVNPLVKDPEISGPNASLKGLEAQQYIRQKYLGMGPAEEQRMQDLIDKAASSRGIDQGESALLDQLHGKWKQAEGLQDFASKLDPQYAAKGLDYFGNNIFSDVGKRVERGIESQGRAEAMHGALARAAVPAAEAGPGSVPVLDVLKKVGLKDAQGGAYLAKKMDIDAGKLADMHVPGDVVNELTRYVQAIAKPEATSGLLKAFDSITNLTKAGMTAVWPAKYARDFGQGVFMNWVHDVRDPAFHALDPRSWLSPYQNAKTVFRDGGVMKGAGDIPYFRELGLSDEEATKKLADLGYAYRVAGPDKLTRGGSEGLDLGSRHAAEKLIQLPGEKQPGALDIARTAVPGSLAEANPLGMAGVGNQKVTTFAPARAGGEVMNVIDDSNRGAAFIAKMQQGYSPEAAAKIANKAQYDYSNLSRFEQSAVKRVVPFYSFMRQNIPAQLEQILQKPGGKVAASIKATDSLRHDQGFVPEYVGEGLAVPIGKEDNGTQRFLSHFGLPFEDAFSDMGVGPHPVQRTLQNILSEFNPLFKLPIELASGKQLMSGRDLADLRPGMFDTGNQVLDEILHNSPLSRFQTTGQTLADERKGIGAKLLNLVSPVKVTDVDLDKQRNNAARELIDEMMQGNPDVGRFERLYVKPENLKNLSPQDLELMRLYTGLEDKKKKVGVRRAG
jgi:hypothetical protein